MKKSEPEEPEVILRVTEFKGSHISEKKEKKKKKEVVK